MVVTTLRPSLISGHGRQSCIAHGRRSGTDSIKISVGAAAALVVTVFLSTYSNTIVHTLSFEDSVDGKRMTCTSSLARESSLTLPYI